MIPPSVGRVVWYHPAEFDRNVMTIHDGQPLAATVAYVWSNTCVNLSVCDHNGTTHSRTSVILHQGDGESTHSPSCQWMPYQKGQAAKTEQLETKLAGGA